MAVSGRRQNKTGCLLETPRVRRSASSPWAVRLELSGTDTACPVRHGDSYGARGLRGGLPYRPRNYRTPELPTAYADRQESNLGYHPPVTRAYCYADTKIRRRGRGVK